MLQLCLASVRAWCTVPGEGAHRQPGNPPLLRLPGLGAIVKASGTLPCARRARATVC
jgi:hypothetical protein